MCPVVGNNRSSEVEGVFPRCPGGTDETFIIRDVKDLLRIRQRKVVTVATFAVPAALLIVGRTANTVFKIPVPCDDGAQCAVTADSQHGRDLIQAKAILWDGIVMCSRIGVEAVEKLFRDISGVNKPFGGNVFLLSGDFRKILHIVRNGSQGAIVDRCLINSSLFLSVEVLRLSEDMRLKSSRSPGAIEQCDSDYPNFSLKVGEGEEEEDSEGRVDLPDYLKVVHAVNDLINDVFEGVETKCQDEKWLLSRAILATTNPNIEELNKTIGDTIPGVYYEFLSAD